MARVRGGYGAGVRAILVLDPAQFFRINRGNIVTHGAVDTIQPYFGNRLALGLKPTFEKEALVSREKVSDFKVWMGK